MMRWLGDGGKIVGRDRTVDRRLARRYQRNLFNGGREVARTSGAMTAAQIVRWVRDHLTMAAT
jgi:hypothetical protein